MTTSRRLLQVGATLLVLAATSIEGANPRRHQVGLEKSQLKSGDSAADASEFGAGIVQGHSKYFQYAHVPHKDHYEVGHRRGNDHHFIERHEKAHPHAGEFKTKVRWGDKHGGYGEHYWDYNHAGHGDSHDEGTEQVSDYKEYDDAQVRPKRHHEPETVAETNQPKLVFDLATGQVVDQNTGRIYILQPLN